MSAIFKNTSFAFGGAFPANSGIVNSVGGRLPGTLMQNLQATYAQQVNRIYELGNVNPGQPTRVYFVGNRPQGQMAVGHVWGPGVGIAKYLQDYGDICKVDSNQIELNLGGQICRPGGNSNLPVLRMTAGMCSLSSFGFSTNVGNMTVQVQSSLEFANLDYQGD